MSLEINDLPWWTAPVKTPEPPKPKSTWSDLWDALFGRLETFHKVEHDGSWFICEPSEVWEYLGTQAHGDTYTITDVRMTRRQFNSLPEFEGF